MVRGYRVLLEWKVLLLLGPESCCVRILRRPLILKGVLPRRLVLMHMWFSLLDPSSIASRIEPWMHAYNCRLYSDTQPEIQLLAITIRFPLSLWRPRTSWGDAGGRKLAAEVQATSRLDCLDRRGIIPCRSSCSRQPSPRMYLVN